MLGRAWRWSFGVIAMIFTGGQVFALGALLGLFLADAAPLVFRRWGVVLFLGGIIAGAAAALMIVDRILYA